MFKNYIGWHLELTQRCPLACPACERTIFFEKVNPKLDINTQHIKNFFSPDYLKNQQVQFQGNLGDPIYHPEFHEIAEHFFTVEYLNVTTNGMHRQDFWRRVLETWPSTSEITLSIDGLQDTNHLYRVNSKWDQIQGLFDLIASTKRQCKIEWKFIVFEHNYHQVEQAQKIAKSIGIDKFRIQKTRYLDPDDLGDRAADLKEYHDPRWFQYQTGKIEYKDQLSPFCHTGDMHYIDARGDYYPCCWWADNNIQTGFWDPVNIKDNTIADCKLAFNNFAGHLAGYINTPDVCKFFCRTVKDNTDEYKTMNTQLNRKVIHL